MRRMTSSSTNDTAVSHNVPRIAAPTLSIERPSTTHAVSARTTAFTASSESPKVMIARGAVKSLRMNPKVALSTMYTRAARRTVPQSFLSMPGTTATITAKPIASVTRRMPSSRSTAR